MYVTGFVCYWGTIIALEPEPKPFNKGLIFMKDTDILLSGDKWTFAVNVALNDYLSLIKGIRFVLGQIR
jgi:hypothetical protein